jgi:hypothetical protein
MKEMNFSNQALGAVMMALQRSLLEQSDIVPVLKGFQFKLSEEGLIVMNPPVVKFNEETTEQFREAQEEGAPDPNGMDVVTDQPSTSK